jgi:cell division protein FtsI (penicillin-binding protein 3)
MISSQSKQRLLIVFFIGILGYIAILMNVYIVQIRQGSFFSTIGQQQWCTNITTYPPRAWIYDRTGKQPLAMNKDSLAAFIVPTTLHEPKALNEFLLKHFPAAHERLLTHSHHHFMYVKRKLTHTEQQLIEQSNLKDIHLIKEPQRVYPVESMGPLLGITDIDNQGIFGIELLYNNHLAGSPTTHLIEKDARSGQYYFAKETKVQGISGTSLTLTIDSDLQFLAYEELKETVHAFASQEGSVIIMDPTNGDILVMATYPDFDPTKLTTDDIANTRNRPITDTYEFGSVMKAFVALAALEEGLVHPDELIDCENTKMTFLHGARVTTWREHGLLTFTDVIAKSNNIGIVKVAQRLGNKLHDHYLRCGFGKKTGILFPGEQPGFVNPPHRWTRPSLISLSFGYEITATLLQLACAYALIANEGKPVIPRLVLDQELPPQETPRYSPQAINAFRTILQETITHGTAQRASMPGFLVMGKTGSANLVIDGVYNPEHSIFTFASIIEKGAYKRVIVTFIKEINKQRGILASSVAVPLSERIAHKMIIRDQQFIEGK